MSVFTLDQFHLAAGHRFATDSFRRAREHVGRATEGRFDLALRDTQGFRHYENSSARLGGATISLVRVDTGSGYEVGIVRDPDLVQLQFLVDGRACFEQGATRLDACSSQLVVLEAQAECRKQWAGSTRLLMMRFSRSRLERIAAEATGRRHGGPLSFGPLQVLDHARITTLWQFVATVCRDLSQPSPSFTGPVAELAERTLALLLLDAVPNSHRDTPGDEAAAPAWFRRLEALMRQQAAEPIGIGDLAAASGRSARSVYLAFRRHRGTTPMEHLKSVRLDLAREALLRAAADGTRTVTDVALACGYANASQFARDYRLRFGETPSRTRAG